MHLILVLDGANGSNVRLVYVWCKHLFSITHNSSSLFWWLYHTLEWRKKNKSHPLPLSFGNYESENDKMPQTSNSRVGVHEIYCVGYCLYVQFRSVKYWIRSTQLIISYNFATYFEYIWVISHPGGIRDLIYVGVNSFIF